MSKPKQIGTAFETAFVKWLHDQGETRAERIALHAGYDEGDVANFWIAGLPAIAECKHYGRWGKSDLERWQTETIVERNNRGADVGLLVVHKKNCGPKRFGQNHCYLTIHDLAAVAHEWGIFIDHEKSRELDTIWAQLDLDTLAKLMHFMSADEIGGTE